MARSRERQRKNRRLKAELHSVDRFNGSRISDPTAYQAQKMTKEDAMQAR